MQPRIPAPPAHRAALALVAFIALVGGGCGQLRKDILPNQPPEVRLTAAPVTRDSLNPSFYQYKMQWVGYDPDGRVDHYLWSIDPRTPMAYDPSDTNWKATARNESTFFFTASTPTDPVDTRNPKAEAPHVFSIFAVDDRGRISERPATRAFFSFTQCPEVRVTDPSPSAAFTPNVTPTVTIQWTGVDPDGQDTRPKQWKFRLFSAINADYPTIPDYISFALTNPDSMRKQYAPKFMSWDSCGAETTSFQYRNLGVGSSYLFVVTGFDEAGAYDPVFAGGRNMLKFAVTFAGTAGPVIRMFNQFFDYTYQTGGYDPSEPRWFRLEVPSDQKVTFNWVATAPKGADIRRYRWVMDLVDLTDETARSNEETDWYHWSAWSRNTTSAQVGGFTENGETHLFYIEAEDNNGSRSLGIIFFRVVRSTFEREVLFVDDTRFKTDIRSTSGPNVDPPSGPWPTAAELDTFLFAKGGFPWKSYPIDPATGQQYLSPPGIFNGYPFDTIGTRGVSLDGTVPLSLLGLYKYIVWYTDEVGANYNGAPSDRSTPITALRLVNSPGRPVILSTYMTQGYLTQGGKVWLCGGGAAMASLITWNRSGSATNEYTSRDNELVPGRMMYDFAHWREGIQMLPAVQFRKFGTTSFGAGSNRPGRHWPPAPPLPTPPTAPNYSLLPDVLQAKNPATDPVPPLRNPDSFFYRGTIAAEYIYRPTFIREDYDDDPELVSEFSTLDTLYLTSGGTALPNGPAMTYYHGRENQPMVFSGFNFWYFRRSQCIALVDWVLNGVWGIPRDPSASRSPTAPPLSARRAAR